MVYGLDEKLNHTPSLRDRGEVIGFYAVAKLKDGGYCFEFMSRQQVEKIQADAEKKNKFPSAVWRDHFVEMGRKTVIRRLAKYLPLSIEFQTAVALDNMAETGKDQGFAEFDGEYNLVADPDLIETNENKKESPEEPKNNDDFLDEFNAADDNKN